MGTEVEGEEDKETEGEGCIILSIISFFSSSFPSGMTD